MDSEDTTNGTQTAGGDPDGRRERTGLTPVEQAAVDTSLWPESSAPGEHIGTIVVDNFPALGKLAAMRFVEWVQENPEGVIALPTGKTPEHFITWVMQLLRRWHEPWARAELEKSGVDPAREPDLRGLRFVQIDEFYPMDAAQHNSFFYFVSHFYIEGFGLDPARALLINCNQIGLGPGQSLTSVWPDERVDLSLRYRAAGSLLEQTQKEVLSQIDQWCQEREQSIRELGGIGFFLGGIGPDGHIGFNVRGSDHFSTTRMTQVNYETQAAAASDLGGIEAARRHLVITVGLGTITYNPACCAVIIAAGAAKAAIVAAAIQDTASVNSPATALRTLPRARFFLTSGAAGLLRGRQAQLVARAETMSDAEVEKIVVDLALARRKRVVDLKPDDFALDERAAALRQKRADGVDRLVALVRDRLVRKIERGSSTLSETRFLHTEPHQDDLMLGCLPHIVRHMRDASNTHSFACLTSGFTSVSNHFMQANLDRLRRFVGTDECAALMAEGYFDPDDPHARNRDVWQYLDGVAAADAAMCDEGTARRLLRDLLAVYGDPDPYAINRRIEDLDRYFRGRYPGEKDVGEVQLLKGRCREWEAECIWGYFGWDCSSVAHLRLGFYTGDMFTEEPTVERDVLPIVEVLERVRPHYLTVALDPEASGPDTHYKVLQAIAAALRSYEAESGRSDIRVWGYRNVWYRFHPAEAGIYVPVSLNMLSVMHSAFMNTFISQRDASFPSYEHDGPFSELAQRIQVEQYQMLKTCLGREWFQEHPSPLIRATRGLVFLEELSLPEFYQRSRELMQVAEDR